MRSNKIWRRRHCEVCASIFTTLERADLASSFAVTYKKNRQKLRPFLKEKLFLSIYESCRHRPSALTDATELTETVIDTLPLTGSQAVTTNDIAQTTYNILQRFDKVAATFYKAYHFPSSIS